MASPHGPRPERGTQACIIRHILTLPRAGRLSIAAESAYQLLPDMGMIFHATRQGDREAIAAFVTHTLLS